MLAIENGTVYTPTRVIPDGIVLIEDRHIRFAGPRAEQPVPQQAERIDARGGRVAPGLIDMHMHGLHGHDLMDHDLAGLQQIAARLPRYGVTTFVPTTVTSKPELLVKVLATVRAAKQSAMPGAELLGVHVEGPFLSAQERGAHRADLLRFPLPEDQALLLDYGDVIRSCTLAPELPGALDLIRALRARGILVSVGHSNAVGVEMEQAIDAGLSHATHLFGNMSTLRRVNLRRFPGVVESVLLDDRVTAEVIGDGYHIAPGLMKLALKCKGPGRLAVVTDASPLTGQPPGAYHLWGIDVILEPEIAFVADRSAYAGSVATLDRCLTRVIESTGMAPADALQMVTLTPATILGIANRKGSLTAGKEADVVILDREWQVVKTLVAGNIAYTRD